MHRCTSTLALHCAIHGLIVAENVSDNELRLQYRISASLPFDPTVALIFEPTTRALPRAWTTTPGSTPSQFCGLDHQHTGPPCRSAHVSKRNAAIRTSHHLLSHLLCGASSWAVFLPPGRPSRATRARSSSAFTLTLALAFTFAASRGFGGMISAKEWVRSGLEALEGFQGIEGVGEL